MTPHTHRRSTTGSLETYPSIQIAFTQALFLSGLNS